MIVEPVFTKTVAHRGCVYLYNVGVPPKGEWKYRKLFFKIHPLFLRQEVRLLTGSTKEASLI